MFCPGAKIRAAVVMKDELPAARRGFAGVGMRRRKFLALLMVLLTSGADASRVVRPIARTDRNSMLAHRQLIEKAGKGRIDVYFEGDSITRRWGTSDPQYRVFLANWKQNFHGWNAANFGWGGDTVQNILWRLENGELDGVHPKVIVLMAGTNNVGNIPPAGEAEAGAKAEEVTQGTAAVLDVMRRKAPDATIVLTAITPRNDGRAGTAVMPLIERINADLARLCDGKRVRFVNVNDKLADRDGKLRDGVTVDGLHLSLKGYQVWADALKPILTELLGPPAAVDHAPEPTGDPSAQRR
jgi:lysophospholipase L1-like esterase